MGGKRLSLVLWAAVVLGTVLATTAQAGMSQGGLLFRSKSAEYDRAPSYAPGAPAAAPMGGAGQQNMQWYQQNNPAAAAFKPTQVPIARESSKIKLDLVAKYGDEEDKELRRYEASFSATYVIRSTKEPPPVKPGQKPKPPAKVEIIVFFPFPGSADTVPEASLLVNGKEPKEAKYTQDGVSCELTFMPQEKKEITVTYRAFGTEDFVYMLEDGERIKVLEFTATVHGTQRKPALPAKECLQPTTALTRQQDTYAVAWSYQDLLTKRDIIIQIPAPIVGSDIAQRMPNLLRSGIVSLVLFGLLLVSGGLITEKRVTLGQFVLLALPVVLFYPLLLQLSKYLSVYLAFAAAFVLMALLVLGNLRRVQGARFAWTYGLFGLVAIIGLFSVAALLTKGAGTVVTIAVFILCAYLMHAVPRLPAFLPRLRPMKTPPPPPPLILPEVEAEAAAQGRTSPVVAGAPPPPVSEVMEKLPQHFCAYCGRDVEDDYAFCPGCGKEARVDHACPTCGADLCNACAAGYNHCPGCGMKLDD